MFMADIISCGVAGNSRRLLGQAVRVLGGQGRLRSGGQPATCHIRYWRHPLRHAAPAVDTTGARPSS